MINELQLRAIEARAKLAAGNGAVALSDDTLALVEEVRRLATIIDRLNGMAKLNFEELRLRK